MCGIVASLDRDVDAAVDTLAHRGPDANGGVRVGDARLGHTRLAIIDVDHRSDQPFRRGAVTLTYNGELWNWRALRTQLEREGEAFATEGDTEVVAALLDRNGPRALARMEGMFAMAWTRDDDPGAFYAARDRHGETPLHVAGLTVASERKALRVLGLTGAQDFPAASWARFTSEGSSLHRWYNPARVKPELRRPAAAARLRELIAFGAGERTIADVPVCTLLSGGIDSSAIAYHLREHFGDALVAYVAVMDERSPDVRHARLVAEELGIELREVRVEPPTPEDLAKMVEVIELPSKAQVEIAWPCWALARRISRDGFKVTYSGEGSDELWGSYGFAYHGVKARGWYRYRQELFATQASRNFMRANKVFMAHGVECRLPFLSTPLVEYALSLPQAVVEDASTPTGSKAVLRAAYRGILPDAVLDRAKMAFQDGLGMKRAAASVVADPRRFYRAEYGRRYG